MKKIKDKILEGIVFMLVIAVLILINTIFNTQAEDLKKINSILDNQKKGKRVDPFRCSDAKKYFKEVNISVDCKKIEEEVNKK